jgi:ribosomal protein S18 acetylase RimI-like enzyme
MVDTGPINIRELVPEDAAQVAGLHIQGIATGFISSLGLDFVAALYRALARSNHAFGLVAELDGRVVGFVAFAGHIGRLYRAVLLRHALRFGLILAGRLFSWSCLKHIFETCSYAHRTSEQELPTAELLAVAVDEQVRRHGVARDLIHRGLSQCGQRGIQGIKVCVARDNAAARALYEACGFTLYGSFEQHGVPSTWYTRGTCHSEYRSHY